MPTEFEIITALAMQYYADTRCDIVALEVGLGGRWDMTNIISPGHITVITSISLDHTAILGDTIDKIDFGKLARISQFAYAAAFEIGNLPGLLKLDADPQVTARGMQNLKQPTAPKK
jgi:folylpolyglutamate synthase/dihydropteroate synthase